jgi:signal transduction histidine kinase
MRTLSTKVAIMSALILASTVAAGVAYRMAAKSMSLALLRVDISHRQLEAVQRVASALDRVRADRGDPPSARALRGAWASLRLATEEETKHFGYEAHGSLDHQHRLAALDDALTALIARRAANPVPLLDSWVADEASYVARNEAAARRASAIADVVSLAALIFSVVTALAATALIVPRIRTGLSELLRGCARVANGDFATPVVVTGRDELSLVAQAINTMAADVQRLMARELETSAAVLKGQAQMAKMAAVGQLASGLAHELNNPLGVIVGFAQGMERRLAEKDPMRLPVTSIVRESLRCSNLVRELLQFARTGKVAREPLDLKGLVEATVTIMQPRAKAQQVKIVCELGDTPTVDGNRTQLQQVLVNLGANSLDAMRGGGTLTVRTGRDPAGHAVLEVTDTGDGIDEAIQSRIFDPFFTTKAVGEGTGLGLSISYEIAKNHGGDLTVRSGKGEGTSMRLELPPQRPAAATQSGVHSALQLPPPNTQTVSPSTKGVPEGTSHA